MKFRKGKKPQNGQSYTGRFRAQQSGPRNRLRTVAANKVAKVKRLKEIKKRGNGAKLNNRKSVSTTKRLNTSNVMDARVKLLQKALVTPTKIVDARQKLTKQKDAREKIQERRLKSSHENDQNAGISRRFNNQGGRVKIDRRGILTVKSILDERSDVHRPNPRNRQRTEVGQRQYSGAIRRSTNNTYNSNLNTFRSDRPIEELRAPRRDARTPRRPIPNTSGLRRPVDRSTRSTRINEKPYSRPMAMDYDDSMEWEENSRYSPTPVLRRNIGNSMFSRDNYHEEMLDSISRGQRGLSETLRSRLDSHQSVTKRTRPSGHKIVISNLEPSVTSEDIRELFADIGDLLESRVVRPGVAEVIYERRADAIQAVDVYHNRQLDGRPMKCDMVRNAGSNANSISVSGSNRRMPSRAADMYKPSAYVTYDIDAVHTALFNK
ncbi:uncharacterized protein LOC126893921 [Daktulosphaira vitifoliae]|uniref:uncharacterized protein LOC126893921 n=1 Tax=Daktulosphaira vitifoliae TaxID=58002 RepID=UPI0021AAA794|nr:uncharacterized protein LOC126893921 [Daktulosphaira vitifoliae]